MEKYVVPHVLYLKKLIKQGHLIVSGPTVNARKDIKEAYLIFKVKKSRRINDITGERSILV